MGFLHLHTEKTNNKECIIMTNEQRLKNLKVPQGKIDVVLDTDAYN